MGGRGPGLRVSCMALEMYNRRKEEWRFTRKKRRRATLKEMRRLGRRKIEKKRKFKAVRSQTYTSHLRGFHDSILVAHSQHWKTKYSNVQIINVGPLGLGR